MQVRAIYLQKPDSGFSASLVTLPSERFQRESLAVGEVLVRIKHSTINYKDGLAITNRAPVVRTWPMVAGVDGAGEVIASADERWHPGDLVLVNGWGLGETSWGCLADVACLRADWLIAIPAGFSTVDAMSIGTAGYTAMLSCLAIRDAGVTPQSGEVLVTGASGGVGSIAIAILSGWGFNVVASTGKAEQEDFLRQLGAATVIDRQVLSEPGKALQKERWAAVVDSVGSHTLVNACAQTRYGGVVTACGLAQGMDLPGSVAPFILRGVSMLGIDSVMCPLQRRQRAWQSLASELDRSKLARITETIGLGDVIEAASCLMSGGVAGRLVVAMDRE